MTVTFFTGCCDRCCSCRSAAGSCGGGGGGGRRRGRSLTCFFRGCFA